MSGTFRIPLSNSLQFVRTEDSDNAQTDFNRLYGDYEYYNRYIIDYAQKYNQSDDVWIQFRTNYTDIDIKLFDSDGNSVDLTYTTGTSYDDYTYYTSTIDTSSLSGCYYIYISLEGDEDKPIAHYKSQWFNIKESHDNTLLIEWYGNNAYSDGMDWGEITQSIRVEGWMVDDIPASETTTTRDDNNNLTLLNYYPIFKKKLTLRLLPNYIAQLLNRSIGHDTFIINGQVFAAEGSFDFGDRHGNTLTYSPAIELELKDYENYAEDDVLAGDLPILPTLSLQFDTGIALQFDTGIELQFQ